VDDSFLVRRLERFRHLTEQRKRLVERNPTSRKTLGKAFPRNQLHDQKRSTVDSLEPMDGGDVRMIQRPEKTRLPLEPGEPLPIRRERFRQRLDRDLTTERRVAGAKDLPHAATPDQGFDLISAEKNARLDDHRVRRF
jgi:hypothetical protein